MRTALDASGEGDLDRYMEMYALEPAFQGMPHDAQDKLAYHGMRLVLIGGI